jgi:tetratricopeptide (TPR) repeat protein
MGKSALLAILLFLVPAVALADDDPQAKATAPLTPAEIAKAQADELDRLFAQLHRSGNEAQAPAVEQKIWIAWSRHVSPTAEVLLSEASKAMGAEEFPAAEEILDKLVEVQPQYAEAWNRRATLNFLARRYDKALADINMVLDLEPRHFGALAGRGMIYEAMGKPDMALQAYRDALAVDPYMQNVKDAVARLEKARPDI